MSSIGPLRLAFALVLIALSLAGCGEEQPEPITSLVQRIAWLKSTYAYGHTCVKIQTDEHVIYLDPVDLVVRRMRESPGRAGSASPPRAVSTDISCDYSSDVT